MTLVPSAIAGKATNSPSFRSAPWHEVAGYGKGPWRGEVLHSCSFLTMQDVAGTWLASQKQEDPIKKLCTPGPTPWSTGERADKAANCAQGQPAQAAQFPSAIPVPRTHSSSLLMASLRHVYSHTAAPGMSPEYPVRSPTKSFHVASPCSLASLTSSKQIAVESAGTTASRGCHNLSPGESYLSFDSVAAHVFVVTAGRWRTRHSRRTRRPPGRR
jgi:hypothetical protein